MSENSTETTPLAFVDEMHELTHKQIEKFINERNALVGQANAANGDRVTLTEQITENSTDPAIVEAREMRDEAIMRLHELVTPKVNEIVENAAGSVVEVEESIKEIDGKLKPGLTYYKKVYGEDAAKHLPSQERLKGTQIRSGGGGRRVRGFKVDVTVDGETTTFDNFASAAKYLEVDTTDLQEKFFEKAGNPKQVKDAPDVVNMTINYTEVDEDETETEKEAFVKAWRPTANETPADEPVVADEDDEDDEDL